MMQKRDADDSVEPFGEIEVGDGQHRNSTFSAPICLRFLCHRDRLGVST
jgi:hypothetical protein